MTRFYDALETRAPEGREAALMAALPAQVAHARSHAPAFAAMLADIDPASITSRAALARLPVTRKHELHERQRAGLADNAFGGFSAIGYGAAMPRIFCAVRSRFSRGRTGAQQLQLSLCACRLNDGKRRACAWLHRLSRRHWPDRAAGASHGRAASGGLHRHTKLSQADFGKSRRAEATVAQPHQGAAVGGAVWPATSATEPPTWG